MANTKLPKPLPIPPEFTGDEDMPEWLSRAQVETGEPYNKTLGTRVPENVYDALAKRAEKNGVTPSVEMRRILMVAIEPDMLIDTIRKPTSSGILINAQKYNKATSTEMKLMILQDYLNVIKRSKKILNQYIAELDAQIDRIDLGVEAMQSYFKEHPYEIEKEAPDTDKPEPSQT